MLKIKPQDSDLVGPAGGNYIGIPRGTVYVDQDTLIFKINGVSILEISQDTIKVHGETIESTKAVYDGLLEFVNFKAVSDVHNT